LTEIILLEMFDPRGPSSMMHAPLLRFAGEDGRSAGSSQTIRPSAGLLFLFRSFLLHTVYPYTGNYLRTSTAFQSGPVSKLMTAAMSGNRVASCG
jgi:hypothetical protein